jgi:hypothetical protein
MKPLRLSLLTALLAASLPNPAQNPSTPPIPAEPKKPIDWFRRADDLTNIRLPGSAPFHMKVVFHAYSGYDFAKPGQSTILTGDGTYEETWLSPETWRREVTLGTYHAIEVRADGVRKFQANSDYEPSRVLMLLRTLYYPVPRRTLEPELQEKHSRWKIEHLAAGALPYVRISLEEESSSSGPLSESFEFLPNGTLIRSSDLNGLVETWQKNLPFASKQVPRHIEIQGDGLDGIMVAADVEIGPLPPANSTIVQISGDAAAPGLTLRPLDQPDVKSTYSAIHFEAPQNAVQGGGANDAPPGVMIHAIAVIDRAGMPREAEMSGIRRYGQPILSSQLPALAAIAQHMVESLHKDRFHPGLVDGNPCQYVMSLSVWTTPYVQSG